MSSIHVALQLDWRASVVSLLPWKDNPPWAVIATAATLACVILVHHWHSHQSDDLPVVNRLFSLEPSWFARLRWSIWAQSILDDADRKYGKRAYRLAVGNRDLIVLPARAIPELNRLGSKVLDSRKSHAVALLGHLTGMKVVEKTSYHVRMLLGSITPALSSLFAPTASRIASAMEREFPTDGNEWTVVTPLPAAVSCFSEGIALALYGAKMSNDPKLVELTYTLTRDVFTVAFAMRCIPGILQPLMVWLLPAKWNMEKGWRLLASYVVPQVLRQKKAVSEGQVDTSTTSNPDLVSCMVKNGRTELERDPEVLTTLCGSIAAGSTYSIANFVCRALADMVAHPQVLDAVRNEIRDKHIEINGQWDTASLASLDCLESAMKETARLAPGTLIVYSRVVQVDCVVDGVYLKKGQSITVSGPGRAMDDSIYENARSYDGLRFCREAMIEQHHRRPFSSVDTDILTWGAGRWACPGRFVADLAAKILLIKLIDEFDFRFVDNVALEPNAIHEFLFFHPDNKMLMRRRTDSLKIDF